MAVEVNATPETAIGTPMQDDEIDLLDIAITLARHKNGWLQFTAFVAVLTTVVVFLIPSLYTAETLILPPQQSQSAANVLMGQLGALGALAGNDLGLKNPADLYAAMLKTSGLETALVKRFDLQKVYGKKRITDAREKLEKRTTIKVGKEGLISISVEDRDPNRAAQLANGYVDELHHLTENLAIGEAAQRRLFFENQLKSTKEKLAEAEAALEKTQERTGLIALDAQSREIIQSVALLRAQIAAKEIQITSLRAYATAENPELVQAEVQLDGMKAQLSKLTQQKEMQGDLQVPTSKIPAAGLEYIRRLRDVRYYEAVFDVLSRQFEAAKLDEAREGAVIQVVDVATVPEKRSFPKRLIIILIATACAALGSMVWAVVHDHSAKMRQDSAASARLDLFKSYLMGRQTDSNSQTEANQ